ncbi:MAG TPA: hypothetical protein VMJ31_00950 [Methylocystis sp.]|nr:hypothetical protein [Methylocystis sp.]
MLDMVGSVIGMTGIAINIVAMASVLPLTLPQRLTLAAGSGAWVGLATGLAASGALTYSPEQPVPLVGVLFATPLLAAAIFWVVARDFREALLAIPTPLLIGLNALRVFGVIFLVLAADGRLSGPFPYSAGLGDVITGATAIPVAFLASRASQREHSWIAAWNAFGALDLFLAVGLGLASAEGSPLQLLHVGVGSEAMQHLPFALVPTVLVPFFLITHGVVAAQLLARRRTAAAAHA